jgi:predicted phosphodiesterase
LPSTGGWVSASGHSNRFLALGAAGYHDWEGASLSTQHRIALISDLHGNALALREVLRSIRALGVDQVVCLGDVATLGVAPSEVVHTLQDLGCACIMGNHDEYVLDPELIRAHGGDAIIVEAIEWCRDQLSPDQVGFLRGFQQGIELPLSGEQSLRLFHGSPSSNMVDLLMETEAEVFDQQLGPDRAVVMAGGHTHVQMLRQHRGVLVVNPGSVGAAFLEPIHAGPPTIMSHAEYASVEVRDGEIGVTLHRVPLDRRALAQAALDSTHPMSDRLAAPYL